MTICAFCGGNDFDQFCHPADWGDVSVCLASAGISAMAPIAARSDLLSIMASWPLLFPKGYKRLRRLAREQ
jgi:hypothetical protein